MSTTITGTQRDEELAALEAEVAALFETISECHEKLTVAKNLRDLLLTARKVEVTHGASVDVPAAELKLNQ